MTVKRPTDADWVPPDLVKAVLEMRQDLIQKRYEYGPYALVLSEDWLSYIDQDYYQFAPALPKELTGPIQKSIRHRLLEIQGILTVATSREIKDFGIALYLEVKK
jgi:hypothetical protein